MIIEYQTSLMFLLFAYLFFGIIKEEFYKQEPLSFFGKLFIAILSFLVGASIIWFIMGILRADYIVKTMAGG